MAIFGRKTFLVHSLSAVKIRTDLSIVLLDNKSADGDGHTNWYTIHSLCSFGNKQLRLSSSGEAQHTHKGGSRWADLFLPLLVYAYSAPPDEGDRGVHRNCATQYRYRMSPYTCI